MHGAIRAYTFLSYRLVLETGRNYLSGEHNPEM